MSFLVKEYSHSTSHAFIRIFCGLEFVFEDQVKKLFCIVNEYDKNVHIFMSVTIFMIFLDFLSWHIDCIWTIMFFFKIFFVYFICFKKKLLYGFCPVLTRCKALCINISLFSNFQHLENCNFIRFVCLRSLLSWSSP